MHFRDMNWIYWCLNMLKSQGGEGVVVFEIYQVLIENSKRFSFYNESSRSNLWGKWLDKRKLCFFFNLKHKNVQLILRGWNPWITIKRVVFKLTFAYCNKQYTSILAQNKDRFTYNKPLPWVLYGEQFWNSIQGNLT